MQYVLGGLYIKTIQVTVYLLLGLYHASVNWISIVLINANSPPPNELCYGIGEKSK